VILPDTTEPTVKESILQSTKKLLGLAAEYDVFDIDIITHMNTAFSTLYQAGVGVPEGFVVEDKNDTWAAFIGNKMHIQDVKTYVYLRVKMLFDPPTSSFALTAIEKQLDELLWRLNVADDFSVVVTTPAEDLPAPM
jgi:hypothetical protein